MAGRINLQHHSVTVKGIVAGGADGALMKSFTKRGGMEGEL